MVCSMSLVRPGLGSCCYTDSATTTTTTTTTAIKTIITTTNNKTETNTNLTTSSSSSSYFLSISSSSTLTRFLITVLLLLTFVVMSIEGSPIRHRRDTVSQLVDMTSLRNPCAVNDAASASSSMDCSLGDPVKLTAKVAKTAVIDLQKKMGSNTCSGMSLDATFRIPTLATTMTNEEKLREIYKSLLKHYAFMQAVSSLNTSTQQNFESSLASLKNLQCSMLCHLGESSSSFLDEAVVAAGSINVDTRENESGQILSSCLIINSTLQLLDLLIEVAQG